jgi:hypothetical protein
MHWAALLLPSAVVAASSLHEQAIRLMEEFPLLDTHIDLPQIIRSLSTFDAAGSFVVSEI